MTDSQISDLTKLLPAPPAPDLPADRERVLRDHLLTEFRLARDASASDPRRGRVARPARRRGRRPLLAAVGAGGFLTVALVTALALVLSAGQPAGASPAAVQLLAKVADAAARQPAPRVSDSEFMYIRSEVAFASYTNSTMTMAPLHERQIWLPVANICDSGLLIEDGSRTSLASTPVGSGAVSCGRGNLNGPTYRLLQSLPADPRALLNLIYAQTGDEGQAIGHDGEAFVTIGDLIREAIVPPRTAAALYRAAALIPGVTFIGRVTNATGRPGIAIARTNGQIRQEWIFDQATLQFVGERDYDMSTGTPVVNGDTAIVQRAFVSKAGQLP